MTRCSPDDARTTAYLARTEGLIAEHGWAVQAVLPLAADPEPASPFSYTVGLSSPRFGHPEFVVFGLPPEVAHTVLNDLGGRVRDGRRFHAGERIPDLLQGGYVVELVWVDNAADERAPLSVANRLYGYTGPVDALQVVWPRGRLVIARRTSWVPFIWRNPLRYTIRPEPGELLVWQWAVWRVVDVKERGDDRLALYLRREAGPRHPWERREGVVHVAMLERGPFQIVEVYPVCSCHGHPWPCKQMVMDRQIEAEARALEVRLGRAVPGVCAACGEPVSSRQRHVVFPGENLLVPGGPPATFHLRDACRRRAEGYEEKRLTADPTVTRLCTCPGVAFEHRGVDGEKRGPLDCSAGPACTGHHFGRAHWCGTSLSLVDGEWPRPLHRCDQSHCNGLASDGLAG